jgi:hypothetical protein
MKKEGYIVVIIFFVSITLFSCKGNKNSIVQGKLAWDTLIEKNDTLLSPYYLPTHVNLQEKHKAIYLFDPQGKPENVLSQYAPLAEKYGVLLFGFKAYQNGQDVQKLIANFKRWKKHILSDFPVDSSKVFLAGFSGGAQFASMLIQGTIRPKGVLLAGLFAPTIQYFDGQVMLICGIRDFNYQYFLQFFLQKTPANIHFLFFDGKHEWPDTTMFEHFLVNSEGAYTSTFQKKVTQLVDEWLSEKKYLLLFLNLPYLSSYLPQNKTQQIFNEVSSAFDFNAYLKDFQQELNQQQVLLNKMVSGDTIYFKNWLDSLKQVNTKSQNILVDQRNERCKAYAGIVLYSLTKDAFNKKSTLLPAYLKMYELVEPENTEMLVFKAAFLADQGQCEKAKIILDKAYKVGFNDKKRLYKMPEFSRCRSIL